MAVVDEITACGVVVRPHEHSVVVHGAEVELTSREFEIVTKLAEHPGWVFSAEQLCSTSEETDYSSESVSVLVSRLRRKLARLGARDVIETVRGFGYRLRVPSSDADWSAARGEVACGSLRDAAWRLQEAVLEAEHSGGDDQRQAATDALESARRAIYAALAK